MLHKRRWREDDQLHVLKHLKEVHYASERYRAAGEAIDYLYLVKNY
jgi:hypothetical protein